MVEEETSIDSIPAAAKAAILKKVGDGKLGMVELFMRGGETMYEAAYTTKAGKKHEVLVKARRHGNQGLMMTIVRFVAVAAIGFFGGLMPAWPQSGSRGRYGAR